MSIKNKFIYLLLFILVGCTSTTVRQAPNYKSILANYKTMVLLPVEVEMKSIDASGKEKRFYDYEYHLETLVKNNVIPEMRSRGFNIVFLNRKDAHDKGIYNEVLQLRNKYNDETKILHDPSFNDKNASSVDISFSTYATKIGKITDSDLIMIVDFSGYAKTSGSMVLNLVAGMLTGVYSGGPSAGSTMLIGIIDAKSGNLLWNNISSEHDSFFTSSSSNRTKQDKIDNKTINTLLKRTLKPFCYRCEK